MRAQSCLFSLEILYPCRVFLFDDELVNPVYPITL